ncbi:Endonuclease 4 [Buchnera aphidicola (Tetraneura ulmi)]|uniref:deoxyribonuclease IV n=1 Tax=Buchnera aphidicola TaxID=9 RepID=UPI003463A8DE
MRYIGAHVSALGGVGQSVIRASNIKANAFSFFTKNQRRWKSLSMKVDEINNFKNLCKEHNFSYDYILPHASYLINLGHPNKDLLKKSRESFIDEIKRCQLLNLRFINFHPGNHLYRISEDLCLQNVSDSINIAIQSTEKIILVIENTAGQGSSIGYRFEHLAKIIDKVEDKSRIGVCLDTCHLFASGYELRIKESFDSTFKKFEKIIGFQFLFAMHLNDSKKELNSRVDRHENLGKGKIGYECFSWIIKDYRFCSIPLILETPNHDHWEKEIFWLRSKNNFYT